MNHDSLRRLMRRIALGIPFAIPVIAAPFNVGGCIPLGYECPVVPSPVIVEHEVTDTPLDCAEICNENVSCAATDESHVQCDHLMRQCGGAGRRPEAGLFASAGPSDPVAAWLHDTAVLEAGSVAAFEALADDLVRLGAPSAFVERARGAAREEAGHARIVNRLLEARGVAVPTVRVPASAPRGLFAIALENATEGCVGEAWAALEAHVQSERAEHTDVRAAMRVIAQEEASHAVFSLDLHAWVSARLTPDQSREVARTEEAARVDLRQHLATRQRPAGLGLLEPSAALAFLA